jgi:hypothetical protein
MRRGDSTTCLKLGVEKKNLVLVGNRIQVAQLLGTSLTGLCRLYITMAGKKLNYLGNIYLTSLPHIHFVEIHREVLADGRTNKDRQAVPDMLSSYAIRANNVYKTSVAQSQKI